MHGIRSGILSSNKWKSDNIPWIKFPHTSFPRQTEYSGITNPMQIHGGWMLSPPPPPSTLLSSPAPPPDLNLNKPIDIINSTQMFKLCSRIHNANGNTRTTRVIYRLILFTIIKGEWSATQKTNKSEKRSRPTEQTNVLKRRRKQKIKVKENITPKHFHMFTHTNIRLTTKVHRRRPKIYP